MQTLKGYVYGTLYILSVSFSTIWLNKLGNQIPAFALLFYASIFSIFIFNCMTLKKIKLNYNKIALAKKDWLKISIILIFIWGGTYYSTIYGTAEFLISIAFISAAMMSALSSRNTMKAVILFVSIISIYLTSRSISLAVLATSVLTGISSYIYYKVSCRFAIVTQMNAIDVLAIRFYFVPIFAFCLSYASGDISSMSINPYTLVIIMLFSLANIILPAYFSQNSLQIIKVEKFTYLNTLIPAMTYLFDAIFKDNLSIFTLLICTIVTIVLNIDYFQTIITKQFTISIIFPQRRQ